MKILIKLIITLSFLVYFSSPSFAAGNEMSQAEFAKGSYIFVFKDNVHANDVKGLAAQISAGERGRTFHLPEHH